MIKNNPIAIRRVANGFIVEPAPDARARCIGYTDAAIHVFETHEALDKHIRDHFPDETTAAPGAND